MDTGKKPDPPAFDWEEWRAGALWTVMFLSIMMVCYLLTQISITGLLIIIGALLIIGLNWPSPHAGRVKTQTRRPCIEEDLETVDQ